MSQTINHQLIQLYSRPECHLCDEAELMLHALNLSDQFEIVDIEPNLKLLQRYGDKVPVLRFPNSEELHWPFSAEEIKALSSQ